jgi:hypothetical protein
MSFDAIINVGTVVDIHGCPLQIVGQFQYKTERVAQTAADCVLLAVRTTVRSLVVNTRVYSKTCPHFGFGFLPQPGMCVPITHRVADQ